MFGRGSGHFLRGLGLSTEQPVTCAGLGIRELRARGMPGGRSIVTTPAGRFFSADDEFRTRLHRNELSEADGDFLERRLFVPEPVNTLAVLADRRARTARLARVAGLDYLILVPTLRCNLSCSYCQVSRAPEDRKGFDWTDQTLAAVLAIIDGIRSPSIKIEFQGGEPTLRLDLINAVIERCERFDDRCFVVCSNLSRLEPKFLRLLDRPDVFLSTSLDGDAGTHRRNRTVSEAETASFLGNLDLVLERYGPGKVSALPTLDPYSPPEVDALIDSFADRGLNSIFLRPINYQGFARKRHAGSRERSGGWNAYYTSFVKRLIERNWQDRTRVLEETYLSLCLRRVFQPGHDRHVDLRNPNPVGVDYVVIDHDGTVYPTDEARMLSRSRVIDLSIGDVHDGWDSEARAVLDAHSDNLSDPTCRQCAYQPFCGRDLVDDLSRYGRIDLPRHETAFCQRHLHMFDLGFELIYSADPATRYSLARWLRLPGNEAELGIMRS